MNEQPTAALVHELADRTDKTTPIAAAIREDIVAMCKEEPFDLRRIRSIGEIAQHGRNLLACRNPVAAFDAKQGMHLAPNNLAPPPFLPEDEEMEGPSMYGRRQRGRRLPPPEDELKNDPLAKAVKAEVLEIAGKEPFAATELLEIQQLTSHALAALMARLGMRSPQRDPCVIRPVSWGIDTAYNPGGYGSPNSLATSPETFGATVARELLGALRKVAEGFQSDPSKMVLAAATARERGMEKLADELEAKLRGPVDAPKPEPKKKEG
jgi:hypothetical protein